MRPNRERGERLVVLPFRHWEAGAKDHGWDHGPCNLYSWSVETIEVVEKGSHHFAMAVFTHKYRNSKKKVN
jgi:hypothetical protein